MHKTPFFSRSSFNITASLFHPCTITSNYYVYINEHISFSDIYFPLNTYFTFRCSDRCIVLLVNDNNMSSCFFTFSSSLVFFLFSSSENSANTLVLILASISLIFNRISELNTFLYVSWWYMNYSTLDSMPETDLSVYSFNLLTSSVRAANNVLVSRTIWFWHWIFFNKYSLICFWFLSSLRILSSLSLFLKFKHTYMTMKSGLRFFTCSIHALYFKLNVSNVLLITHILSALCSMLHCLASAHAFYSFITNFLIPSCLLPISFDAVNDMSISFSRLV